MEDLTGANIVLAAERWCCEAVNQVKAREVVHGRTG